MHFAEFERQKFMDFKDEFIDDPHIIDVKNDGTKFILVVHERYENSDMFAYPTDCGYTPVVVQYGVNGTPGEWEGSYH